MPLAKYTQSRIGTPDLECVQSSGPRAPDPQIRKDRMVAVREYHGRYLRPFRAMVHNARSVYVPLPSAVSRLCTLKREFCSGWIR